MAKPLHTTGTGSNRHHTRLERAREGERKAKAEVVALKLELAKAHENYMRVCTDLKRAAELVRKLKAERG